MRTRTRIDYAYTMYIIHIHSLWFTTAQMFCTFSWHKNDSPSKIDAYEWNRKRLKNAWDERRRTKKDKWDQLGNEKKGKVKRLSQPKSKIHEVHSHKAPHKSWSDRKMHIKHSCRKNTTIAECKNLQIGNFSGTTLLRLFCTTFPFVDANVPRKMRREHYMNHIRSSRIICLAAIHMYWRLKK